MIKKIAVLATLAVLLVTVTRLPQREMGETEALKALLDTVNAEVVEGEVQFYATVDERYRTMDELEELLLQVSDLLGVTEGNLQRGEGETYRVLDIAGQTAFGPQAHIVVQSNPAGSDDGVSAQTYLLIICRDPDADHIATMINRLDELVMPLAPEGHISFYLTGELPGQHSLEEMDNMARRALKAVRAEVVEGMQDQDLVSLTAYTPLLDRHITMDGERFNLNVAIRYDDYFDKTVLWAGYPLIHGSY